jgi:hypothetical protein
MLATPATIVVIVMITMAGSVVMAVTVSVVPVRPDDATGQVRCRYRYKQQFCQ